MNPIDFNNPFKPGAGHMPPYLAGREHEMEVFTQLLQQTTILENLVLTGLRGVGKTVLLNKFKPLAMQEGWLWVGTDLSEASSITEETMSTRLLTDISVVTSNIVLSQEVTQRIGFQSTPDVMEVRLSYQNLNKLFHSIPGLTSDKLKGTLEYVWECLKPKEVKGVIFAYDEAQTISDHPQKEQYPLSLLLDTFQSLQRKDIPFMLVLTGLPTLFPKLVDVRTYAERMFQIVFLNRLPPKDSQEAILKPIEDANCPVHFSQEAIDVIVESSGGYPYFIQFLCKESYDVFLQKLSTLNDLIVPIQEITRKLDRDFFAGRWSRATDRQRELLSIIASLPSQHDEFTVQEIVDQSKKQLPKPFSSSHVNQMLSSLINMGLIYKNRHGKYSFAVPLLGEFILRQYQETKSIDNLS